MIPLKKEEQNLVRFLRELVIDILNTPEYEQRLIHFETAGDTLLFSFDSTLLTRAFRNLILNAFLHGEPDTQVSLHISREGNTQLILVSDDGRGIPEQDLENVFCRYYRGTGAGAKPEGSGLGLAIAQNIVQLHGGTISVSSRPGEGTSFRICFPLS